VLIDSLPSGALTFSPAKAGGGSTLEFSITAQARLYPKLRTLYPKPDTRYPKPYSLSHKPDGAAPVGRIHPLPPWVNQN